MDNQQIWNQVLQDLKQKLDSAIYLTFLSNTRLSDLQPNLAKIACPSNYVLEANRNRYQKIILENLNKHLTNPVDLEFILDPTLSQKLIRPLEETPLFNPENIHKITVTNHGLHPRFTFENLVVGNSNNFAYAAAQGIINNPGTTYNPLFIWGGVGVGKTHLMQAIGHELLKKYPQYKIKYFPSETFTNDLFNSLKSKNMASFKDKYRTLDCILVDDIQFIAGKEYTQEEFFHTFNALYLSGKQIILTSDRKPSEIKELEDRLVSRFQGGLTVDIQLPDYEMRLSILRQKALEKNLKITPEALTFLAQTNQSNIRDLEGKLQESAILAIAGHSLEITLNIVSQGSSTTTPVIHQNSPRHIISVCAKTLNIKTGDLIGHSRQKSLVQARHLTAYILLTVAKLPLQEVGELLGGRDHTSIIHARDKIHHELSTNQQLTSLFQQIQNNL